VFDLLAAKQSFRARHKPNVISNVSASQHSCPERCHRSCKQYVNNFYLFTITLSFSFSENLGGRGRTLGMVLSHLHDGHWDQIIT